MHRLMLCLLVLGATIAQGIVQVQIDTSLIDLPTFGLINEINAGIRVGIWDRKPLLFAVKNEGANLSFLQDYLVKGSGVTYLQITSQSFRRLSAATQQAIGARLATYYGNDFIAKYKATVAHGETSLSPEPLWQLLKISLADLPEVIPAEDLLSPYARRWAYQSSEFDGPNCWHTSIASIFPGWQRPRYMAPEEFECHLKTSFEKITEPSQWGDLIRVHLGDEEVHGFTYLGVQRGDPGKQIVFTKNGYAQGYYLFMDLETVLTQVYPGNDVEFYREKNVAIDPAEHSDAPCAGFKASGALSLEEADPIITAGMRRKDTRSFPPLVVR